MTIIESLQTYIKTYSGLKTGRPVWVNFLGSEPTDYSIVPLQGTKILESYLNGTKIMKYSFALETMESTADDLTRLQNLGFYEAFSDWLDSQTKSKELPILGEGQTAQKIEAVTGGCLMETSTSETGRYQIICDLEYRQEKMTEISE
jgi:hypothetical protein